MSNMLDYLDWRGDITIHQSGINDVDCLIMSQISYMNFSEVVDAKDNYVVVVEQEELQNREEQVVQMDLNFATELNLVLKCKMADY